MFLLIDLIWTDAIAVVLLAAAAATALFFLSLRHRWFSRFRRGFLVSLTLALAGAAVLSAMVVAVWGFESSRHVLSRLVDMQLENASRVVESVLTDDLRRSQERLRSVAAALSADLKENRPQNLKDTIREIQTADRRYLLLAVFDACTEVVASSTTQEETDGSVDRVAVAFALDGKEYISEPYFSGDLKSHALVMTVPIYAAPHGGGSSGGTPPIGALACRFDFDDDISAIVETTRFNGTGYAVVTDHTGRILAHPNRRRLGEDISAYPAVQLALKGQTGSIEHLNAAGISRLFHYRPLESPATVNPQTMALLTEMEASEVAEMLFDLREEFALGVLILALCAGWIAWIFAGSIRRPIESLVQMAQRVEGGDLTASSSIGGRDSIGQLSGALNRMVHGLQERDRVKELFGRYVTTQVSEEILHGTVDLGGSRRRVTVLFSDIRDFTGMSEQMSPEEVVSFLNDYFTEMVEAVFEQGGVLDKFIGDGLLAVFGSLGEMPDHPRRAVMAALRMKSLLSKINGERTIRGQSPISIGIGIHTDDVIVGNIGSRKRLEYTVVGDGVNTSARVEALNKQFGTTILITGTTYELVKDEFECRHMPEAALKGKGQSLQFYEVISRRVSREVAAAG